MYEMIREWPHYVNVPFPIAKVSELYYHLPRYGYNFVHLIVNQVL